MCMKREEEMDAQKIGEQSIRSETQEPDQFVKDHMGASECVD